MSKFWDFQLTWYIKNTNDNIDLQDMGSYNGLNMIEVDANNQSQFCLYLTRHYTTTHLHSIFY